MLKRSFGTYVAYFGVGMVSMMTGATVVHELYKPDLTIPDLNAGSNSSDSNKTHNERSTSSSS
jgi:hypothetical protein